MFLSIKIVNHFVFQNSIIEDNLENIRQNCQQVSELKNQLEFCKKNCAEKEADICNKNSEIEKLEVNYNNAQEKIAVKVNELQQRDSELAALDKKLKFSTSDVEEKIQTIQVTSCCTKQFPQRQKFCC